MKKLLDKQIRTHLEDFSKNDLEKMEPFLEAVLSSYESYEKDRILMNRSLNISSHELLEKNEKLKRKNEKQEEILNKLKKLIGEFSNEEYQAIEAVEIIKKLRYLIRIEKYQEYTIKENKDKLEAILLGIGDGVFVTDIDGEILIFNKMASQITGYSEEEIIGENYEKYLKTRFEKIKKPVSSIMEKALQTQEVQHSSDYIILTQKNGEEVAISISVAPLLKNNNDNYGFVFVIHDVQKLRDMDHMKNEFISILSHELRTPMTVTRGYLELFLSESFGPLTEEQAKWLRRIDVNIERLIDLVNDMLDLSKMEENKMLFKIETINIQEIVKKVSEDFKNIAQKKNIKIITDIPDCELWTKVDKTKIQQVLNNLLGNAYKFTEVNGEIKIQVTDLSGKVEVSIIDNGIGIAEEDRDLVFQKFSQINNPLQKNTKGTGLGLSICKNFIEKMGGKIDFQSKVDEGSRFFFSLEREDPPKG